jgi:hypothetical protein
MLTSAFAAPLLGFFLGDEAGFGCFGLDTGEALWHQMMTVWSRFRMRENEGLIGENEFITA